mmetsp:Transcript_4914/g.13989  ORF Transcript_4914/g.13989 Transcript_4914/m.13989 type:complete len:157 (+) Transcript_4914:1807-2277(+)
MSEWEKMQSMASKEESNAPTTTTRDVDASNYYSSSAQIGRSFPHAAHHPLPPCHRSIPEPDLAPPTMCDLNSFSLQRNAQTENVLLGARERSKTAQENQKSNSAGLENFGEVLTLSGLWEKSKMPMQRLRTQACPSNRFPDDEKGASEVLQRESKE